VGRELGTSVNFPSLNRPTWMEIAFQRRRAESIQRSVYCSLQIERTIFKEVTINGLNRALSHTYHDILQNRFLQVSAALSYYFTLSVFPGLIFLSAVVAFIPLTDLFGHVLTFMGQLLPPDSMRIVYSVLGDVLSSHKATWLSFGMLGIIWAVSAAFDATIEALDIAYDVRDGRPVWKTRLLAIGLAATSGGLLLGALAVLMVGPDFGEWLSHRIGIPGLFVLLWPVFRWTIAISFTVLAVEALYYFAPNVKQRFAATLPGAVLTVSLWIGLSHLLGLYFRHVANYSLTYGTLGGFIAFMTWLYWISFILLVGAELNAELAKESKAGELPAKTPGVQDTGSQTIDAQRYDRAA
jgi:membrane protein